MELYYIRGEIFQSPSSIISSQFAFNKGNFLPSKEISKYATNLACLHFKKELVYMYTL